MTPRGAQPLFFVLNPMPYKVFKQGDEYCVYKVDANDKRTGDSLGCHPSMALANNQVAALYASEGKGLDMTDKNEQPQEETKEVKVKNGWGGEAPAKPTYGAASFAELKAMEQADEVKDAAEYFPGIVSNIMYRNDITDKGEALRALAVEFVGVVNDKMSEEMAKEASEPETKETDGEEEKEEGDTDDKAVWSTAFVNELPDSSFLFIQSGGKKDADGKTVPRNYRHFPYKDAAGKVDLPHLRNAIARIPQSNAPGLNKRAVQARAQQILAETQKSLDEETLFGRVWGKVKSALGIEDKSDKENNDVFIWKDADSGKYKCVLAYSNNFRDNDNPPEIITAQSHKEFDEALDKGEWPMPELWLWHVPYPVGHVDFHAYNEESGFSVAAATFDKEWAAKALMNSDWDALSHGMPKKEIVRDEKDETLIVRHRTKEISFLPRWAAANKLTFYTLNKEITMEDKQKGWDEKRSHFVGLIGDEQTAELEGALFGKAEEAKDNGTEQKETAPAPEEQPLTRKELAEALVYVLDEIKAIKAEVKQQEETKEEEPQDLVALLRQHSTIGAEEAKVDGRTKEAKDGPDETPADTKSEVEPIYGVPLLDNLLANKQQYAMKNAFNIGQMPPELLAKIQEANQQ